MYMQELWAAHKLLIYAIHVYVCVHFHFLRAVGEFISIGRMQWGQAGKRDVRGV